MKASPSTEVELDGLFKRLHLANARRMWRDLVARAEQEQWTYHQLLTVLVMEEIAHRQQTRLARLSHRANFPFLKTIDDFDFTFQSTVRLALLGSALSPDFVTDGRALILAGKPGRGKTHLAIAIAYRAIQNGFDALFVTAAELIDELSTAFRSGALKSTLARYTHPDVLVVDEIGYLTYGTDAANMLFHVVNDRHRHKRAMIFTTNKPLTAWAESCTMTTSLRPSSIASSSAVACSTSTAPRSAPDTSGWTIPPLQAHLLKWSEFPESEGQNFRNPQISRIREKLESQTEYQNPPAPASAHRRSDPVSR